MEDSGACRALQCRRSNPNDLAQKRHTQSHKEQESRITQKQEEQELNHTKQEKKSKGRFQIWTKETLEEYGFKPSHAPYYIVLHFDNTKPIEIKKTPNLKECSNTFVAKIRPLSDFIGIK